MTRSRIARLVAAAGLAIGTALLAGPAASASTGTGWVRLAHLSPNTPAVDVYLYSFHHARAKIVLHHVAYGTVSPYEAVPAGEYTVAMRAANAAPRSKPVLSTNVDVLTGKAYTVAGMGPFKGLRLQILHDALKTPKGKALVRVIQASLQQHTISVRAGGHVVARGLHFGRATRYRAVPAGSLMVRAAGSSEHTSLAVPLAAGTVHTLVVLDDPGHLQIDNLTDSAGSQVTLAPQTGLGGTAPKPGSPMLPWLLVAASGLLVTAGGIRVLRVRARALRTH
jgi:hypothetical protein